ncbi:MAG: TetR/AcrR family transcriptional regulator [Oscillospiraceae bacterium]|nr:TetR/AcrR family transcriptional regulator [Oscillospiraceae bacterium]
MEAFFMDMRVIKTKRDIWAAFLKLRARLPLEKLKVVDICAEALISKPTFYKYYRDVYALNDELEDEAVSRFLALFTAKDCLFDDPLCFQTELHSAMETVQSEYAPLFRDLQLHPPRKFMEALLAYYSRPDWTPQEEFAYTFTMGGLIFVHFRVMDRKNRPYYNEETVSQSLAQLISRLNPEREPNG